MIRKILLGLVSFGVALYVALCGYLFATQRSAIYLPHLTAPDSPAGYAALNVTVPGIGVMHDWSLPADGGQPVVIFFHGNAATTTAFSDVGASLHARGWGVVLAGYPGYSGNPGTPSEDALMADARATIAALPRGSRIIVWGHSLGSGVAARMASEGRAAGLVLEAPYTALPDIAARLYPYIPVRLLMLDKFDTASLADRIKVPVLIFHSTDDPEVPFAMGESLAHELGPRATFVRMKGAGHHPHRRDLTGLVVKWVQDQQLTPGHEREQAAQ
jgi:hypothetical protein